MTLFTIGFTKKSAMQFFELLKKNDIVRLIDIRESNTNIYAGFTMRDSLSYFLKEICDIEYIEMKELAPTKILRKAYHLDYDWKRYESGYLELLNERKVMDHLYAEKLDKSVLLCSEPTAEKCHRRLAAEYISKYIPGINIVHL